MRVGLKKKNQREKLREENEPVVHTERERERLERIGHNVDVYGACRLARSSSGEGQRVMTLTSKLCCFRVYTKSMVFSFVKICDFFFIVDVLDLSEPC